MLTQSVTTAILFATGDAMAQQLVEKKGFDNHELARTGRMAFYGGSMSIDPDLYRSWPSIDIFMTQ
jgi:protein Mpv17